MNSEEKKAVKRKGEKNEEAGADGKRTRGANGIAEVMAAIDKIELKVKLHSKDAKLDYKKGKNIGMYMKLQVEDDTRADLTMVAFDENCDFIDDKMKVSKCYKLKNVTFKLIEEKWQKQGIEYQVVLTKETSIKEISGSGFTPTDAGIVYSDLNCIKDIPEESIVNAKGTITQVGDIERFSSSEGSEMTKREVVISDGTSHEATVTFWFKKAESINLHVGNEIKVWNGIMKSNRGSRYICFTTKSKIMVSEEAAAKD